MRKIYLLNLMFLLPTMAIAEHPRILELAQQKQEKMERLQKCEGTTKGLKIAGLSTLGLTAVGVVGNIAEAKSLKNYESENASLDDQITGIKKEIQEAKAEKAAAAAAAQQKDSENTAASETEKMGNNTADSTTTSQTEKDKSVANDEDELDMIANTSFKSKSMNNICDGYKNKSWQYEVQGLCGDDMLPGEWEVEFNHDLVKGMSVCTSNKGNYGKIGNPNSTKGGNCWCQITKYKKGAVEKGPSLWGFAGFDESTDYCLRYCAKACTLGLASQNYPEFRTALYESIK